MLAQEIIRKKRDGEVLDAGELQFLMRGLVDGKVSNAQAAAFAMSVYFNGMEIDERVALTVAMRDTGDVLSWDLDGPVVDKHSTGGVGDNVSLMLAPALAACGVYVPMISGRGLGHTGGTLDKFDSIPGYQTQPDVELLRKVTQEVGCAIIGQTGDIAPADKVLYGIRDVTATVESVDLITASILSKKLAAGLDALVLDVKCGNGAFMATPNDAHELAESLVKVANGAGCKTSAIMTDMNEPLASAAGNAVEVRNAVDFLTGTHIDNRLWDVTSDLGAELLVLAGVAPNVGQGRERISDAFTSGAAAERFGAMVSSLGGPTDFVENMLKYLPAAPVVLEVFAKTDGFVRAIETRDIGMAVIELGGGRRVSSDTIDHSVGFSDLAGLGRIVDREEPIGVVHALSEDQADAAAAALQDAMKIGDTVPMSRPLIREHIEP
ncbi:thymidine phosphorylase [Rhodobacterales bacterium 52_120_T64]|nr:thymidine phosphorylase [Rhodobacterales bacterium 52_120_T64]